MKRLARSFFARDVLLVARDLVGCEIVHVSPDGTTAGRIVETEAYRGPEDLASHSAGGRRTARNEVMWGKAGVAYLFVVYGHNWAFNVVTGAVGEPHAVLIRAIEPLEGVDLMRGRRGRVAERDLTSGPGKLCAALGLAREQYGLDLCERSAALFLRGPRAAAGPVRTSPRIGIDYAGSWVRRPWRFFAAGSPWVSRTPRSRRPRQTREDEGVRFWPFGRKSEGVEFVTRVVTAPAVDGSPLRARLTLHFSELEPEESANSLADQAALTLEDLLRRSTDAIGARNHEHGLGKQVLGALDARATANVRKVDVGGVHAVRVAPSARPPPSPSSPPPARTPSWAPPPGADVDRPISFAPPPKQRPSTPPPAPLVERAADDLGSTEVLFSPPPSRISPPVTPAPALLPSAPRVPDLGAPPAAEPPTPTPAYRTPAPLSRTRTSARFRAVTNAIFVPRGATNEEIAAAVQPVVADASARMLVGALRFYDLLVIRGVNMSEVTQEMLTAVAPVSDAPCGQYEQSRAGELDRWRQTLGGEQVEALHQETWLVALYLLYEALTSAKVRRELCLATLDALALARGGTHTSGAAPAVSRYLHTVEAGVAAQFVSSMAAIVGVEDAPIGMDRAVATVVAGVQEELRVAALVVELSQRP